MKNLTTQRNRIRGFGLLEVSIALALTAMGVIATLQMRAAQAQLDTAKSVAQTYERYSNAMGTYMTLHYKEIVAKGRLNPECGALAFKGEGFTTIPPEGSYQNCRITLNSTAGKQSTVLNFLQPTPSDLANLGILPSGLLNQLPLPTYASNSKETANVVFGRNELKAESSFALLVQLMCVGGVQPQPDGMITGAGQCQGGSMDLRSLVFNLQPYAVGIHFNELLLAQIQEAGGGGRTYYSDNTGTKRLKAHVGAPDADIPNPLVLNANPAQGLPYILAMRNGYGSSGMDAYVRRDGSLPLTAEWNVGGQNISGVGNVATATLSATGAISGNSVSATGKVSGYDVSGVNVSGGFGYFGDLTNYVINNVKAAFKASTAYISDTLTVSKFMLESEANLGGACNPKAETLRRATTTSGAVLLLVCDRNSNSWSRAQEDYGGQINSILTNLGEVNQNLNKLNQTVNNLSDQVSVINSGLANLNNNLLRWSMEKFSWTPAKCTLTKPNGRCKSWTASSKVWQKTQWQCLKNPDGNEYISVTSPASAEVSYTMPILVSGSFAPIDDTWTYSFKCVNALDMRPDVQLWKWELLEDVPSYWYVGFASVSNNLNNGNCETGMSSNLLRDTNSTYSPTDITMDASLIPLTSGVLTSHTCLNFNPYAPSFNTTLMSARFMAFTRLPKL